jgi:hypothetical protein
VSDWLPCVDSAAGVLLERPAWWEVAEEDGDLVLVAPAGEGEGGLTPRVTVSRMHPAFGVALPGLDEFAGDRIRAMGEALADFLLVDEEDTTVSSQPARRILAACRDGALSVTVEEWWTVAADSVITVSAVAPTMEYDEVADLFARIAGSLQDTETGSA